MTTVVVLDTDFLSAFLKIQRLALVRDLEREDHYGFRREVRELLLQ